MIVKYRTIEQFDKKQRDHYLNMKKAGTIK
jgi:hypothetical protein